MTTFLQFAISGLTLSAMYSFVAVGWSLGWSVSHTLNLMVGEYVVLGALTFATLRSEHEVPLLVAALAAIGAAVAAGLVTDLLLRILRARDHDTVILVTLAMALMAHELWARMFGRDALLVAPLISGTPLTIGGAVITRQVILVLAVAIVILVSTGLALQYTRYGRGMRACAEDSYGAFWCGIRSTRVRTLTILVTAGVAGVAGVILVPLTAFGYQSGSAIALKGLIAAILGGLGSVSGAVVGALAVGVGEAMISGYISSERASAILYIAMIVILLFAPNGVAARIAGLYRRRMSQRRLTQT